MFFEHLWALLRGRWRWVRGRCPRCNRNLRAAFASYVTGYPNCPICKDEIESDPRVWHAFRASETIHKPSAAEVSATRPFPPARPFIHRKDRP